MKGTAGSIGILYGTHPPKTKLIYLSVGDHTLGIHVLKLTGHRYRGYGLPMKPYLVLLSSECTNLYMPTSLLGHR